MLRQSARGPGTIRLGFLRVLGVSWLPALAEKFLKAHTDVPVRFTFHTGVTSELLEGLKARHFDLVFSSYPAKEKDLSCVPVAGQQLVLIVSKDQSSGPVRGSRSGTDPFLSLHLFFPGFRCTL